MSTDGSRPGSGPSPAGDEHDAWLREALRHAPDSSASPPPSLSDAILAEARAATRSGEARRTSVPASAPLLDRLLAFWSWLARPQVAAGFASVMAATLVGMLWWDRPMDETMLPSPPAAMRSRPEPPAAPADLRDTAPVPPKTEPPRAAGAAAAMDAAPRQQAARATAEEQRARAQAEAKASERRAPAAPARKDDKLEQAPRPSTPTAPTDMAPPSPAGAARPAAEPPSPFPARPAPEADAATRQPAPAPAAPTSVQAPAPVQGRSETFALAKKAESGERERAADKARSGTTAEQRSAAAPAANMLGGAASVGTATRPMAPLLAALASEEPQWSRRLSSGESVAIDPALRAWLAESQSAATRWELSGRRAGPAAAFPAASVRLERDGRPGAVVQIEDGGILYDPISGNAWFAPLAPEVVARLRAGLPLR